LARAVCSIGAGAMTLRSYVKLMVESGQIERHQIRRKWFYSRRKFWARFH
jgi:hypothetical protein